MFRLPIQQIATALPTGELLGISVDNPLARGLVLAEFGSFDYDLAGNSKPVRVGNTFVTRKFGRAFSLNGTTDYVKNGATAGGVSLFADSSSQWSIVVQVTQASNVSGQLVAKTAGSGSTHLSLYLESGYVATSIRGSYTAVGSQIGTNPNQITLTWDGTTAYLHREETVTGTRSVGTASAESSEPIVFGAKNSGASSFLNAELGYVLIYNRAITREEHLAIRANPRAVLADSIQPIWVGSSGTTYTASYSDTATTSDGYSSLYTTKVTETETSTPLDSYISSLTTHNAYIDSSNPLDAFTSSLITSVNITETSTPLDVYTAYILGGPSSYDEVATLLDSYTVTLTSSVSYNEISTVLDSYTVDAGVLTLTQADIDAIANAVWAHPWALNLPKWLALK